MIGFILLQKSEGGGLVSQQGGQSMSRFMTRRGQADFLTRSTTLLATGFMVLCLIIAIVANQKSKNSSLLDQVIVEEQTEKKAQGVEKVIDEMEQGIEAPQAADVVSASKSASKEKPADISAPNIATSK